MKNSNDTSWEGTSDLPICNTAPSPQCHHGPHRNEYSTRSISWGKKELVCKADNLTSILGHGHVIWEPQLPGTLWASQACNGTDLPYFYCFLMSMK